MSGGQQAPVWSLNSHSSNASAFQPLPDLQQHAAQDQPLYQQGLVSMDYTSTPPSDALDDENDDDDGNNPVALQTPATPLATHYALTRSTSQSLFEQSILASLMSLEGGGREDATTAADGTGGATSPFLDFVI
jgi:hypothetical protein